MTIVIIQKRMAPEKQKRKKSKGRVKKDPSTVKSYALCASERTVRNFFTEYGTLLSVTIHHNFLDMEPDGFMYLEYAEKEEAEAAVAAVKEKTVGLTAADVRFRRAVEPAEITGMKAALALSRGEPKFEVDEKMKDILLGRQEMNRFSQSQQEQSMDEDDLILQSLSQHSFVSSQQKKKKKRRKYSDDDSTSKKPKKSKKTTTSRSHKVAIPTE